MSQADCDTRFMKERGFRSGNAELFVLLGETRLKKIKTVCHAMLGNKALIRSGLLLAE